MKKRLVGVVIFSVMAGSCRYFPFWFQNEDNSSEIAEHVATDFYGVYVPSMNSFIGCRWFRQRLPYSQEYCMGIWKFSLSDSSMTLLRDSGTVVKGVEVSRRYRYLAYIRESGVDTFGYPILDAVLMDLLTQDTSSIRDIGIRLGGWLRSSPYTDGIFYGSSSENWGEWEVVWRIDFRNKTITSVDTCRGIGFFWVLPGAKGDSVVCNVRGGPVNFELGLEVFGYRDSLFLTDVRNGTRFYVTWKPSPNDRIDPWDLRWVQDQDTLVVSTFTLKLGFNPIPVKRDLWWIPNVTDHMVEIPTGGTP